jgi:hypothetical protein
MQLVHWHYCRRKHWIQEGKGVITDLILLLVGCHISLPLLITLFLSLIGIQRSLGKMKLARMVQLMRS